MYSKFACKFWETKAREALWAVFKMFTIKRVLPVCGG
jgi:hypothetical protein